jgi:hypothetical protein
VNAPDDRDDPRISTPSPDAFGFAPLSRRSVARIMGAAFAGGLVSALILGAVITVLGWFVIDGRLEHHVGVLWLFLWPFLIMMASPIAGAIITTTMTILRAHRHHVSFRTMFEAVAVYHMEEGKSDDKDAGLRLGRSDLEQRLLEARQAVGGSAMRQAVNFLPWRL